MLTNAQANRLFAAFASQPTLFALKPDALRKAALDVVMAQIKHKDCRLETLRAIGDAIVADAFESILDELKGPALAALVKKYDKTNADKAKDGNWARAHLAALAARKTDPAPPPAKAKKSTKTQKPSKEDTLVRLLHQSKALARRD